MPVDSAGWRRTKGGFSNPWNDRVFFPVSKDVADGCFMPGHGDFFGKLFGVDVRFTSDRRDALDAAITLCPPGDAPERGANPAISCPAQVLPPRRRAPWARFC